jgi:hypothetical protein
MLPGQRKCGSFNLFHSCFAVCSTSKRKPVDRDENEQELVHTWLTHQMAESLLHRLSHSTLLALANSSLEMVVLPAFSLVVAQGGVSDCCYLLVAGSSSLWVSQSPPVGGPTLTESEPLKGSILKSAHLVGTPQPARTFSLLFQ